MEAHAGAAGALAPARRGRRATRAAVPRAVLGSRRSPSRSSPRPAAAPPPLSLGSFLGRRGSEAEVPAAQPEARDTAQPDPEGSDAARSRRLSRLALRVRRAASPRALRRRVRPLACSALCPRARLLTRAARRCSPGAAATRWWRAPCSPLPLLPWRCSTRRLRRRKQSPQARPRRTSAASCARPTTLSWLLRARWRRCRPLRISSPPSRCVARSRLFVAPRPWSGAC